MVRWPVAVGGVDEGQWVGREGGGQRIKDREGRRGKDFGSCPRQVEEGQVALLVA